MFVALDPRERLGDAVEDGHCVRLCQTLVPGLPHTSRWRPGARVRDADMRLPVGVVIATFHPTTHRYENDTRGRSHAAILLARHTDGLFVVDQWVGHKCAERLIRFRGGEQPNANDGDSFYLVETDT